MGCSLVKIEVKNLIKRYGSKEVLKNLSFTIKPGITAVVGHNGAGKSTLFHILCGRTELNGGNIFTDSIPFRELRSNILFEEPCYYSHLTALENLQYINACRGNVCSEQNIKTLMETCGVCLDKSKPVSQYSLGMKKRYAIAAALINDPDFLILDEPQNGLDLDAQNLLEDLLNVYRQSEKILLFSSHQMESVVTLADSVLILNHGTIETQCTIQELEKSAETVFVRVEKGKMLSFLEQPYIKSYEENGSYLELAVFRAQIFDFLKMAAQEKIYPYKIESALPSLQEILNNLEERS